MTADEWAACIDTIGYELVPRVGARVPRMHVDPAGLFGQPEVTR